MRARKPRKPQKTQKTKTTRKTMILVQMAQGKRPKTWAAGREMYIEVSAMEQV